MSIYDFLRASKGAEYKKDKIKKYSFLHTHPNIEKSAGDIAGNSRVYGDAKPEVQDRVMDLLVEVGARYHLPYRDIAHLLLLCKVESGFNPDAAAGTTSASGLGQYTNDGVTEVARISAKPLGFVLDLSEMRRFDAELGAYGVVLSYMKCKECAIKHFGKNYEKYLYLFHHEGWYFNPTPEHLAEARPQSVLEIINTHILPNLDPLEAMLSKQTDVSLKLLTKDDKPHADKPYVAIYPSAGKSKDAPAKVQGADPQDIKHTVGKTDGQGKTAPVSVPSLTEVIFILLHENYKDFLNIEPKGGSATHTVKSGDSLAKIASENGTTVDELVRINHIANPNQIKVGQQLILHDGTYLPRNPPASVTAPHLQAAVHATPDAAPAIVEHQQSHIVLPEGNQAQKHNGDEKVIAMRGKKTDAQVKDNKKQQELPHKTATESIKKTVETPVVKGKPIRAGMLFPLPQRPPANADYHTGQRVFGYPRDKGTRKHAGRDIYAPAGTPVRAMDDGVIVQVIDFYCQTDAVEVDHGGFIVRYGEVQPRTKDERKALAKKVVKKGDELGKVGTLMMYNKKTKATEPYQFSMCHLELYSSGLSPTTSQLSNKKSPGFERRSDLIDAVDTLDACIVDASYWK